MTSKLKKCVDSLKVHRVNTRYIYSNLLDSYEVDEVKPSDLENTQQLRNLDRLGVGSTDNENLYVYRFVNTIGVRCIRDEDKDSDSEDIEPILEIQAQFTTDYLSECELDDEALKAFGDNHVYYHLWPYWREIVQSTCSRMELPILRVSPYQV